MNEPIISPWFFYLIGILNPLKGILIALAILLCIVTFALFIFWADEDYEDRAEIRWQKLKKAITYLLVVAIFFIFIPSQETVIKMAIASKVTPANLQLAEDKALELTDKALKLTYDRIEGTAIKIIQEVKKD